MAIITSGSLQTANQDIQFFQGTMELQFEDFRSGSSAGVFTKRVNSNKLRAGSFQVPAAVTTGNVIRYQGYRLIGSSVVDAETTTNTGLARILISDEADNPVFTGGAAPTGSVTLTSVAGGIVTDIQEREASTTVSIPEFGGEPLRSFEAIEDDIPIRATTTLSSTGQFRLNKIKNALAFARTSTSTPVQFVSENFRASTVSNLTTADGVAGGTGMANVYDLSGTNPVLVTKLRLDEIHYPFGISTADNIRLEPIGNSSALFTVGTITA